MGLGRFLKCKNTFFYSLTFFRINGSNSKAKSIMVEAEYIGNKNALKIHQEILGKRVSVTG